MNKKETTIFVKHMLTEFAKAAGAAAAEPLGKWLVENLEEGVSHIQAAIAAPASHFPNLNDLETTSFLRGRAFSELQKQRLIGSALVSFSGVQTSDRQALLDWAIRNSQNDPTRALYNFLFALSKYNKERR